MVALVTKLEVSFSILLLAILPVKVPATSLPAATPRPIATSVVLLTDLALMRAFCTSHIPPFTSALVSASLLMTEIAAPPAKLVPVPALTDKASALLVISVLLSARRFTLALLPLVAAERILVLYILAKVSVYAFTSLTLPWAEIPGFWSVLTRTAPPKAKLKTSAVL